MFSSDSASYTPYLVCFQRKDQRSGAFEIVGVDFAGPIKYHKLSQVEGKAYLVLYTCSLTRALHLEVLPNLETSAFLGSLKCLVARRGRPAKVFSDDERSFVGAARWFKQVQSHAKVHSHLSSERITWSFNLR